MAPAVLLMPYAWPHPLERRALREIVHCSLGAEVQATMRNSCENLGCRCCCESLVFESMDLAHNGASSAGDVHRMTSCAFSRPQAGFITKDEFAGEQHLFHHAEEPRG